MEPVYNDGAITELATQLPSFASYRPALDTFHCIIESLYTKGFGLVRIQCTGLMATKHVSLMLFLWCIFPDPDCSGGFSSLGSLRFLVIDEADKLLDYHFNQWLPKLLKAMSRDKATPRGCGLGGGAWLEGSLQKLCLHPERFKLSKKKLSQQVCW